MGEAAAWWPECPSLLHCNLGEMAVSDVSERIQQQTQHPIPENLRPELVTKMVSGLNQGYPTYIYTDLDEWRQRQDAATVILTVKEQQ